MTIPQPFGLRREVFRTAGACPAVRSFGVLDSRPLIAKVVFLLPLALEHQRGIRSGPARAGQNDKHRPNFS